MHRGWTGRAMPILTGRMRALAIGTIWNTASGAREERICSALSTSWGELQQREYTRTGQCVQYAPEKVMKLEKLAKFTTTCTCHHLAVTKHTVSSTS